MAFITETESVLFAVRTENLSMIWLPWQKKKRRRLIALSDCKEAYSHFSSEKSYL